MAEIEVVNETLSSFSITTLMALWLGCSLARDYELASKIFQNTNLSNLASTPEEYETYEQRSLSNIKDQDNIVDFALIQEKPTLQVITAKIIKHLEDRNYLKAESMIKLLKENGLEIIPNKLQEVLISKKPKYMPAG